MNNYYKKIYLTGVMGLLLGAVFACSEEEPVSLAPTFKMNEVSEIMRTSATFSGSISGETTHIKEYGFDYSLSEDFTSNLTTRVRVGETFSSSAYQVNVKGLKANERYYYRMYATTGVSTVYSAYEYFQTTQSQAPVLSALVVDSIGEDMARFKCTIEEIGDEYLIEYGVGYKTAAERTYYQVPSDSIIPISIAGSENTFYIEITGLESATKYSFRPYAKNSADANGDSGIREGYGSIIESQTANKLSAVVMTSEIMEGHVGINSIKVSGMVQSADGSNGVIDKCGFCWSATNSTPSIVDSHLEVDVTKVGEYFTATIPDLQPGRTYYVRAYAQNTVGGVAKIGYGEVYEVKTTNLVTPVLEWVTSAEKVTPTTISVRANIKEYDGTALVEKGVIWDETRAQLSIEEARKNNTFMKIENGENLIDATITNLKMNTGYYVRAYAIYQAAGLEEVGYTNYTQLWTTGFERPSFDGLDVQTVTYNSAKVLARISSEGNGAIVERGFCVSKGQNVEPTLTDCEKKVVSDETFISQIDELLPDTRYSVRPYIISKLETAVDTTYCWTNGFRTSSFPMEWDWENGNIDSDYTSYTISILYKGIVVGEILEQGFCWDLIEPNNDWTSPTLEQCTGKMLATETNENGFSGTIKGLLPDAQYNFASYIKVKVGEQEYISYHYNGNSTRGFNIMTNVSVTSCQLTLDMNGYIPAEITEYGFCWSNENNDSSISKNKIMAEGPNDNGEFIATITSLEKETKYYFKVYYVYNGKTYFGRRTYEFTTQRIPTINDNLSPEIKN